MCFRHSFKVLKRYVKVCESVLDELSRSLDGGFILKRFQTKRCVRWVRDSVVDLDRVWWLWFGLRLRSYSMKLPFERSKEKE